MNVAKPRPGFASLDELISAATATGDRRGMRLVARFEYGHGAYPAPWDELGRTVVLRFEHPSQRREQGSKPEKSLTQAHRATDGLWRFGLPNPDPAKSAQGRPLYRLADVIAAREARRRTLLVLEGEKAVDAAWSVGIPATCSLGGAMAPRFSDWTPLADSSCVVAVSGSEDDPGRRYESAVAELLRGAGQTPHVLRLPSLRANSGDDLVEFIAARRATGKSDDEIRDEVLELAEKAPASPAPSAESKSRSASRRRKSPSLAEMAIEVCTLFHDREGEAYASFQVDGHRETWSLRSIRFRRWLGRVAFEAGTSGNRHAVDEAVDVLEAEATYGGTEEREVFRRWAWRDGHLWYDLGDADWRVVDVVADASGVVTMRTVAAADCPVAFVRAPGAMPQVEPMSGGSIKELRTVLNVTDESWTVLRGALVACFMPTGELPIIEVVGEENSGKTWTCQRLLDLTDPAKAGPCPPPRELRDLYVRAKHRRVVALDNVSSLSGEVSDALCRITTGSGAEERAYYTASELETYEVRAPVILNGIGHHVSRPDLASRTLHVETLAIARAEQRERGELLARWQEIRPRVLGALLAAVATAQARFSQVELGSKPRLADAARFVEAAAPALGLDPGEWTATVLRQSDDSAAELVEDSPVGRGIAAIAAGEGFLGSAKDLLAQLAAVTPQDARGDYWPKSPRGLAGALMRLARPLRDVGVQVERAARSNHSRPTQWSIRKAPDQRAGCAERAGSPGASSEALRVTGDAPPFGRDEPDAPESVLPFEGDGTCGTSGTSFQPDVEMIPNASDADGYVDPKVDEESPP